MSDNPYQSPMTDVHATGVRSGKREDLKSVAMYQKGILVCILIYIIAMVCQFAIPLQLRMLLGLGIVALGLAGTAFVFLLAMKVYHPAVGVLLGILTLIPCLGLLVLLMVNGKATSILKQNGIKVGLLGASLSDVQ